MYLFNVACFKVCWDNIEDYVKSSMDQVRPRWSAYLYVADR